MQVLELGEKTDINSTSIGIELDNNGTEVFWITDQQLISTFDKAKERL
jgi:N-acetyl-anhydromuramyl-L-alanine amidase AmpD